MSIVFKGKYAAAPTMPYPGQPLSGPGGAEYAHQSVLFYDAAARADGYWLFVPDDPKPEAAPVIVFLHGYGAYNPMTYGKWIKHLVAKGNIVIYPRYQRNLIFPKTDQFPRYAAKGIHDALKAMHSGDFPRPIIDKLAYIAHSYGGVIATYLSVYRQEFQLPKPAAMMLAQPGSGPFKGARMERYDGLPEDLVLAIAVSEHDFVVGDEFGVRVLRTAVHTPLRRLYVQYHDSREEKAITASHSEPYAYDTDFDNGVRNYTALRVLYTSKLDEVDFFCFWKLADAVIGYSRNGMYDEYITGHSPRQTFMGVWPDGTPIKPLRVVSPSFFERRITAAQQGVAQR